VAIKMKLLSLNKGASHGHGHESRRARNTVVQGQAAWPEASTEAERDLGHQDSTAAGPSIPGTCTINLAIDSKLRGCDLVGLRVRDVVHGSQVARRAIVMQKKTQRPVQFELTEQTRDAVAAWIATAHLKPEQYLFPSRMSESPHVSTRQYSRIVGGWVGAIGLDPATYGTHSLRRTKATLIYRRTKNLRAVQLLLGHTKLESTVRYLGIEVDDALEIAEQTEV
jgi:integrase